MVLLLQFQTNHMTIDMIQQVLGDKFNDIWPKIKGKFKTDGKIFWNERLKEEKDKRIKYTQSRRKNQLGVNHV